MDIEPRLVKLEEFAVETRERLMRIETRLDQMADTMATKSDLSEVSATMIMWMFGMAFGISATAVTIITFVLNNATPKLVASTPAPQPIVIQLPPPK